MDKHQKNWEKLGFVSYGFAVVGEAVEALCKATDYIMHLGAHSVFFGPTIGICWQIVNEPTLFNKELQGHKFIDEGQKFIDVEVYG